MTKDWSKELWLNRVEDDIVYIHSDFDADINVRVLPSLISLINREAGKKNGKIVFDIDSNGGYADVLKVLLTHIEKAKSLGVIVETRCFAKAYSCGSMLAASGSKGHRFISEYAEHLCHLGRGGFIAETDKQLDRQSERLKRHFDFARSLYKKYANIPNLDKVIADNCYFISGKKIIEFGLADKFYVENVGKK
jgi:ATP-dependent protease ClpP protease subunit